MMDATPEPTIPSPLTYAPSAEHLAQLQRAQALSKKIRRATLIARISGVSIAVFAAATLLGGFFDAATFLLGSAMALIAIIELRGAAALQRLDLQAPKRLALNQLAFGLLLIAYAAWQLWRNRHSPGLLATMPELRDAGVADVEALEQMVHYAVFGAFVLAALAGPGLTALYYATRQKHLQAYRQQVPDWIVELQQTGGVIGT